MNPSDAEKYPNGWFTHGVSAVGRCVSVIHTSISPRAASISISRFIQNPRLYFDASSAHRGYTSRGKEHFSVHGKRLNPAVMHQRSKNTGFPLDAIPQTYVRGKVQPRRNVCLPSLISVQRTGFLPLLKESLAAGDVTD
jgi:hypothetical protein